MTLTLPAHSGTTRHVSSTYPFQAGKSLPGRGVFQGYTRSGSAFSYDPWSLYPDILTNPNMIVIGQVGKRKSTLVKCHLYRSVGAFGRWCAVIDPKGEYRALAEALDLPIIRLAPGGTTRLNPLDAGPRAHLDPTALAARRGEMVAHMAATSLGRRLTPEERTGLDEALRELTATVANPELGHVVERLLDPSRAMARAARTDRVALAAACRDVALELRRMLHGDLAGMFDGRTNLAVDWQHGRGLVLDLSAAFDSDALALVMLCASTWLQGILATAGGPKRYVVHDEAWAVLRDVGAARWLQASFKLARGGENRAAVSNIVVIHRLSDLSSGGAEGSLEVKLARGLLSDTGTRVVFQQSPDELDDARRLLGLTPEAAARLEEFPPGRALWQVGNHAVVVDHVRHPAEAMLTDTDKGMT